ncbi:uncharacterized protein J7T54_001038 [Emericellopsis cladophorae]|uniref:AMP-dependent synthetase/ligase domain-containing protein n=1 Tax=Emericellopsis cladophorae TaxID=2686198 RepID=A0A9P9XWT5_9HYPO|nr:uncharacterized protein J7T54_001038 [Emericellopsis cladophorae]KAI6779308.1 hypothetical protein J7T54_001038 [Emericellopsis cladophorae]
MSRRAADSMSPQMFGPESHPRFSTITDAFKHQVLTNPDSLAAVSLSAAHKFEEITYRALSNRAARLAVEMRRLGVRPGDRVPLVVKRGIHMLVGIIAVLSCGAQYAPLDGGVVPDSTLRFVVEHNCGGRGVVLAMGMTKHRLGEFRGLSVICIDEPCELSGDESLADDLVLENFAEPDTGCYIIYTSGDLGITTGTKVGQTLNISFDMDWNACIKEVRKEVKLDTAKADTKQIEVLICTPTILAKYEPQDYPKIKTVATAGEPTSQRLADKWAENKTYYNCCGPTETTIVNTMHNHVSGGPLTIGKPTPGNNVYILNENHELVRDGEPGVMWAGGLGVSKGYVGLPEKTAERYVPDLFLDMRSKTYNTGDLGKWLADGSIEILGRVDDQVKVKGFRVELDGVTASVNSCSVVDRGVVLFWGGEIHAFITPANADVDAVKTHLQTRQPYYAVPSHFNLLNELPVTPNGKIDKKLLKESASGTQTSVVEKPSSTADTTTPPSLEKQLSVTTETTLCEWSKSSSVSTSSSSFVDEKAGVVDLEAAVPDKTQSKTVRGIRHRVLIVYRQLFTLMALLNIATVIIVAFTGFQREAVGTITAVNLTIAVLMRQEFVINAIYTTTCSVPKSWPLWIRTRAARVFHLGGVHSGAGVSAALWMFANTAGDTACMALGTCNGHWGKLSLAAKIIAWIIAALFIAMLAMAYPSVRKAHHDKFEIFHRFVGWTLLGLFWAQVVLTAKDTKASDVSLGTAAVRTPSLWLLVVATLSVASSWFWLKKVPVKAEPLSKHAIRLHFDYTVPVNGSFTRLSHKPLLEWHSFATIPAPEAVDGNPKGYSLVVSNAGDWTRAMVENPSPKIWVRGVPTCGVMRIATLFNRVVIVATGSGIGPQLGHILNPSCPTKLLWSTKDPENTFGKPMCDLLKSKCPDAVIWDTRTQGRPDLVKMSYNLAKDFDAEAVIIIANEKITKKVVYGLETRGLSAYGAIWDS